MKMTSRSPRFRAAALVSIVLCAAALANAQDISDSAYQQMRALLQEKESRNAAQSKLSASLNYAANAAQGASIAGVTDLGAPELMLNLNAEGALVRIKATVSPNLLNTIGQVGGRVMYVSAAGDALLARVPVAFLQALAARGDVQTIAEAPHAKHNGDALATALRRYRVGPNGYGRAAGQPYRFDPFLGLSFFLGSLTSQGVITHGANTAIATYGARGAGVKVGVLSDSAEALPFLIGTGDLPPGTLNVADIDQVINGGPGTSEGSAMMEIIYDMAPGVQLFFASAYNGPDSFADNIRLLRNTYGCDIIVDDVTYSDEAVFQDGVIARAVNDVTQSGAMYFSSVGNSGNLTNGTSGTWEGDFNAAGAAGAPLGPGYTLHSFGANTFARLTVATALVTLDWSDPVGNSSNDYDVFVLNAAGTAVLGFSTIIQGGAGSDPHEEAFRSSGFPANSRVVVVAKAGAAQRALHVGTFGGSMTPNTTGEAHGHNASAGCVLLDPTCTGRAFSVAAVAWNSARGALRAFPGGALNPTEPFSSDGPRRLFYKADGTPITPGNLLFGTNGGTVLLKPDISAADGVTTRTPGGLFSPFFGTSAAAPSSVGVAALVKSARISATGAQVADALTSTALDIRAPGVDRDAGYGIVMALAAVAAILH